MPYTQITLKKIGMLLIICLKISAHICTHLILCQRQALLYSAYFCPIFQIADPIEFQFLSLHLWFASCNSHIYFIFDTQRITLYSPFQFDFGSTVLPTWASYKCHKTMVCVRKFEIEHFDTWLVFYPVYTVSQSNVVHLKKII